MSYVISEGSRSFGQEMPPFVGYRNYARFQLLDQKGVPLPNIKVHIRIEDLSTGPIGGQTASVFTDKDGVFQAVYMGTTGPLGPFPDKEEKYVSLTPLVKPEGNVAIIWRYPVTFSGTPSVIKVVNQPGGGLQPEFPGAPVPVKPSPLPPVTPGAPVRKEEGFPVVTAIVIGVLAVGLGLIVLPKIFPKE